MKRISVLLTKYSDWISSLIYYIGGRGYTHISLGLEEEENLFYSFNYRGFCIETAEKHKKRGVNKSLACEIEIPDHVYADIRQRIQEFENQKASYRYTRIGVLCAVLQIPFRWKYHYICSQFVAELLAETGAVSLLKTSSLYLPDQLWAELKNCPSLRGVVCNPI